MGQAHIRLDQQNVRTAIPSLKSPNDLYFTLVFTALGKEKETVERTLTSGLTLTVELESGDWKLEVKGYRTKSKASLMVQGQIDCITVEEGKFSTVVVNLVPVFSSGLEGSLSYSVKFPETVSRAFLSLYPLDPPGTKQKIDMLKNAELSITTSGTTATLIKVLSVGSYQALLDLYDGKNNKAAVWTGIVHVYDSSTTVLKQEFTTGSFASPQVVGKDEKTLEGKLAAALESGLGSCTIALDDNVTVGPLPPLKATDGEVIAITIDGKGKTVQLDGNGSLFTLSAESGSSLTLVLEDITVNGTTANTAPVVQVNSGGTLELNDGSSLTGNASSGNGGGVVVASGGALNMNGGTIRGNSATQGASKGGGVYVGSGGIFTMNDGEISGNSTPKSTSSGNYGGGGVYVDDGGTFIMTGGVVSENTSGYDGGGVLVCGKTGTFTMSGGMISGNSAQYGGGVYASGSGTFTMTGGVIYGSGEEVGKKNTAPNGAAFHNYGGASNVGSNSSTIVKSTS
jgi:hypothetical protein